MGSKLIPPDSSFRDIWDFIISIFTIFIAIELPLRFAFDYPITSVYIEILITIFLFVDIVINFNMTSAIESSILCCY